VWGSRRLSVRDIEESYRLRYQHNWLLGVVSAVGSYALSLAYLALYGRYVSDTLSGARAVRSRYFLVPTCPWPQAANHVLLSGLMRNAPEIQEVQCALRRAVPRARDADDGGRRPGLARDDRRSTRVQTCPEEECGSECRVLIDHDANPDHSCAGVGSRLGAAVPKVLVHVNGRPDAASRARAVPRRGRSGHRGCQPGGARSRGGVAAREPGLRRVGRPAAPTGMLDAISGAYDEICRSQPDRIWVTWCDQIAVHRRTVARLAEIETTEDEPDLVMPTCCGPSPYIHFDRDLDERITGVRERREGDVMPADRRERPGALRSGARRLTCATFDAMPTRQVAAAARHASGTSCRSFRVWRSRDACSRSRASIRFEAVGINTPEELRRVERHLADARLAPGGVADGPAQVKP